MISEIILPILLTFLNILLFSFLIKIFTKIKIIDVPDFSRKIHTSSVPLAGGTLFIINIFLYFFFEIFIFENTTYFQGYKEILSFLICSFLIYLVGLYDDKYSLRPNTKLILVTIIVTICISISKTFQLDFISFLFIEKIVYLENFGIIFTIFCFLVFINAFNMIDGVNGLSTTYFFICLTYLTLLNFNLNFFLFFTIPSICFLYFNFKNKAFLGDNGSLLLGFVLSCLFIKTYNQKIIFADQIVLLMILPGIDMLRVAIIRIFRKKHPFVADKNHLHHLILNKYNPKISYIAICSIISLSALLSKIIENELINIIQIFLILIVYFVFHNLLLLIDHHHQNQNIVLMHF